jgi:uncharacterized membrane protein
VPKKNDKYSFIVVKYAGSETAGEALNVLRGLAKDKTVKLKDAVAITKTEKGKVRLQQSKDDSAGKGFLKGGMLGVVFGLLFAAPALIVVGAVSGTAVGMFDKGIKNKLMKELGENMTSAESALAVLIESADWGTLLSQMDAQFTGEAIIEEILPDHTAEIEALAERPEVLEAVPDELEIAESAE